jgi:hypothetical protein
MHLRKRHLALCFAAVGFAALTLDNRAALADQNTFITAVIDKGTAPGLLIGYRTSDAGASFITCTISGSSATCSTYNHNASIPKNLGNILCLPAANAKYTVSQRCQALINGGAGSCQTNSSNGKCSGGTTAIMPVCNYRTSSNSDVTANWVWNISVENGQYDVDCLNAGYQGPNPK